MEGTVATWCSCSRLSLPFSLFFFPRGWGFPDMRGREIWFYTDGQGNSTISPSHNTFLLAFLLAPNQTSGQISSGFTAPGKAFTMLKTLISQSHIFPLCKRKLIPIPKIYATLLPARGWWWREQRVAAGGPQRETASRGECLLPSSMWAHVGRWVWTPSHQHFPFHTRGCWCNITLCVTT